MKAKYVRISTANQNTERQLVNSKEFDFIYIDVISGAVPFAERPEALKLLNNNKVTHITIGEVTRLGRNMSDILKTIEHFTNNGINLFIENLGLSTLVNGKPNQTASLIINLLGSISQYERDLLKERTQQGREIAKAKGKFKGRKRGSIMSDSKYLKKHFKDVQAVKSMLSEGRNILETSKELEIPRSRIYQMKKRELI